MELDLYTIIGGIFGLLAIRIMYAAYDFMVNRNPFGFNILGVRTVKLWLTAPMEHQVEFSKDIYDAQIMGNQVYIAKLRKTFTVYSQRLDRPAMILHQIDESTLVEPYFMSMPIPVLYEEEFQAAYARQIEEVEKAMHEGVLKKDIMGKYHVQELDEKGKPKIDTDGRPIYRLMKKDPTVPAMLILAKEHYSMLMNRLQEWAKIEHQKKSKAVPMDLKDKVMGAAPFIVVVVGAVFLLIMMAMQSFSVQTATAKMMTAPFDAISSCQTSLAQCTNNVVILSQNRTNVTVGTSPSGSGGIFDVFK